MLAASCRAAADAATQAMLTIAVSNDAQDRRRDKQEAPRDAEQGWSYTAMATGVGQWRLLLVRLGRRLHECIARFLAHLLLGGC